MVETEFLFPRVTVGAPGSVAVEDVGAELPAEEGAFLVFLSFDVWVLHQLDIELGGFDADGADRIEFAEVFDPFEGLVQVVGERRRQPAWGLGPVEKARLPVP